MSEADFDVCPAGSRERLAAMTWRPIETAPKTGRTLLLGYRNTLGKWRTLRGQWFSQGEIENWQSEDESPEGWYETSVECDDEDANCWWTEPTHWMPLPGEPAC